MLGAEEWMKIEKAPLHIDCEKKYVFTYFLGGITEKVQKQLDEVTTNMIVVLLIFMKLYMILL